MPTGDDLYDPAYIRALFDSMAGSYERVNIITSFGFSRRWRKAAVAALEARSGDVVVDAMTGMGEGWPFLAARLGPTGRIVATDLSPGMLAGARARRAAVPGLSIDVRECDSLACGLPDESVDGVLCLFGIKTLSAPQRLAFAAEIHRILRPGGRYSMIEVSTPPMWLLRWPYGFYLRRIIPLLGRLLLGDPDNYRMLAIYTMAFGDAHAMRVALEMVGLRARFTSHFFGCATGVVGERPSRVAQMPEPSRLQRGARDRLRPPSGPRPRARSRKRGRRPAPDRVRPACPSPG